MFAEYVDFEVDMNVVESFIRPDTVTVSQARGSPPKRSLTVEGELVEDGPLAETETYKRRVLKLGEPGLADHTITLTVWGEEAVVERSSGVEITISAVWKDDSGLRATPSTKIETRQGSWQQGKVVAVKRTGNQVDAMLDGNRYGRISEDLLADLGGLLSKEIAFKFGEGNLVGRVKVVD